MRSFLRIAVFSLLLVLFSAAVAAEEPSAYIFRIDTDRAVSVQSLSGEIEPLSEEAGVYRTRDASVISDLSAAGILEDCSPDGTVYLQDFAEDTAYYGKYTSRSVPAATGCAYAAQKGITGAGVRVAVIDSGLMSGYGQYTDAVIVPGENYLVAESDPNRTDTTDTYGHGTAAVSVIADREFGVAPKATVIPLKCFDGKTSQWSYVVAAIYAAVNDYDCDVISMSLGATGPNSSVEDAVKYAQARGAIVVGAVGNLSSTTTGNDGLFYPAAYDGVIGVGMTNLKKEVHSLSRHTACVDVVAPGYSIPARSCSTGAVIKKSGTSFSTPIVAGAVALALSADPTLTQDEIITLLHDTAEDRGDPGFDYGYGYGFLNIGLLVAAVKQDDQSMSLSCYDGKYTLSAYRAAANMDHIYCAAYGSDSTLEELTEHTVSQARWLGNNLPISADRSAVKLIITNDLFVPVLSPAEYQIAP